MRQTAICEQLARPKRTTIPDGKYGESHLSNKKKPVPELQLQKTVCYHRHFHYPYSSRFRYLRDIRASSSQDIARYGKKLVKLKTLIFICLLLQ